MRENNNLKQELVDTFSDLYKTGPKSMAIWERAGGRLKNLDLSGTGKSMWWRAITFLGQGKDEITITSLLDTALIDFEKNLTLANLKIRVEALDKVTLLSILSKEDKGRLKRKSFRIISFFIGMGFIVTLSVVFGKWMSSKPFNLTVFTKFHKKSRDLLDIKDDRGVSQITKGSIVLWLGKDRREEKIDYKGRVNFNEIPLDFLHKKKSIELHSDYFKLSNRDSLYKLEKRGAIHLSVELKGLDRVYGIVKKNEHEPLEGVLVSVKDLKTKTNKEGFFELNIPPALQEFKQRITFYKEGYESKQRSIQPLAGAEIKILLAPLKE